MSEEYKKQVRKLVRILKVVDILIFELKDSSNQLRKRLLDMDKKTLEA